MKIKCSYETVQYLGDCSKCSEQNLAHKYGDSIIDGEPVCARCAHSLKATERSEGARTSEARQQ
jgi:hypothetical protein